MDLRWPISRFDPEAKRVVRDVAAAARSARVSTGPVTKFLVYREGRIYFEGPPEELAASQDAYLKRFLV